MASKNPSSEIAAQILLDGGYDPCLKFDDNDTFWSNHIGCEDGFIPDYKNGYCYMLLPSKKTLQEGIDYCADNYDAELILFEKNSQVDGFITLMNKGKYVSRISDIKKLHKRLQAKENTKALFTRDILTHNIAIKRYCDKKILQ
jgi:hypothetical protein